MRIEVWENYQYHKYMAKNKSKKRNKSYVRQTVKALLIGTAVVFFWRGTWGLMDLYLFPNDLMLSSVSSVLIGLGILGATHYIVKELI